ncbi:MAG: TonB-dependent receptor [candidate division KSB1 bacterium]|nr:TonB-dependent receptor [candidate division KSB1 bacterium]
MSGSKTIAILLAGLLAFGLALTLEAGQTGKIAGKVVDAGTGEPLPGANVVLQGTQMGAAADIQGDYIILNVPPGTYNLTASMIGYRQVTVTGVRVSVDRTVRIDFRLEQQAIDLGKEIVVEARQPLVQRDLTATAASVSAEEIASLPVESFQEILQLQAGVVSDSRGELHIRGGRASEINYLIDGISVTDPFSGKMAVGVDHSSVQELKVISGTFNAEYGQVMSGIVEVVTKDPKDEFHTGATLYFGDYLSKHKDLFYNIDRVRPQDVYNGQFYATGPVPRTRGSVGYYVSLRRYYNDGWLYGQRRFHPSDSSSFDPKAVRIVQTGDNRPVAMNFRDELYGSLKLFLRLKPNLRVRYTGLGHWYRYRFYNHLYKYNPDGDVTNHEHGITHILDLNHVLSPRTFYTLKIARYDFDFKSYLYKDPHDPRYVNPEILRNRQDAFSFLTGGTNMNHFYRTTTALNLRFDITSQVTKIHQIKGGLEARRDRIWVNSFEAYYKGLPGGGIFDPTAYFTRGRYTQRPATAAAYIQDKIELQSMTVNVGLRYDYFDPRWKVPTDLRDPTNIYRPRSDAYRSARAKHQWSPRVGLAFPITESGVIHASYGHFFQIPPYEYLYTNPRFAVAPGGLSTLMGNADLNPQSTVIYEVGLQQGFLGWLGIDVTGYYKDARNLLGTRIYETYALGDRYARYENRDYGNIRGVTLSINKQPTAADHLTLSLDYTFQIAEGNASDPNQEFYNQQSTPPKKSNIQVVPLNWDQRHTVNLAVSFDLPHVFSAGLVGQFQSGLPYTPAIQSLETTFENSGRKPFNYTVDLRLARYFALGKATAGLFLKVYNLFDRKNELEVYADTGRAGYSLVSHYVVERREDVNTLAEWLKRPDFYSEPRKVLVGLELEF